MRRLLAAAAAAVLAITAGMGAAPAPQPGHYKNFRVAVYVVVGSTRQLADRATFERQFARAQGQAHFDKVYIEVYRDHQFASDAEIEAAKTFFREKGVQVAGGVTLAAGGKGGQFGTFDYEDQADRAECRKAIELAARHFDEVILDDFFFYNTKSDADIAAKGARSWTQYRLDTMRGVARDLVLASAHRVNPKARVIIKYPNWYEHFQGLGFDLDQEPRMFAGIYTGTETRDPEITDQLLQQYESYEVYRYFSNIRPDGGDGGGWVDTFDTRYADRYAEQLWDTLFAKAPEITLFNWAPMAEPATAPQGDRALWSGLKTSLDWNAMAAAYRPSSPEDQGPGWGAVAGASLAAADRVLGELGRPIGIAAYKPYQSSGEDFLASYLGNIGIPIEQTPVFPTQAQTVLLTQSAAADPNIVSEIEAQLRAGRTVVVTSGLVRALQGRGFSDIAEIADTGRTAQISRYINGFGAGAGNSLNDADHPAVPVQFPELHFWTNDSWPVIRGVASDKGFPILLMNRYSKGIVYVLDVPENIGDLYNLPRGVTSQIKRYLQDGFPVRIDSDPQVALFCYDNGAFVVESFRAEPTTVTIRLPGASGRVRDLDAGQDLAPAASGPAPPPKRRPDPSAPESAFQISVAPHSFRVFRIER